MKRPEKTKAGDFQFNPKIRARLSKLLAKLATTSSSDFTTTESQLWLPNLKPAAKNSPSHVHIVGKGNSSRKAAK